MPHDDKHAATAANHRPPIDHDEVRRAVDALSREILASKDWGEHRTRIEALKHVDTHQFGIAIFTRDGQTITGGSADTPFSIQSISKVFSLELALEAFDDDLWKRVGREPSGDPYNSIIDLEHNKGYPRNPFINSGALVVVDMLVERFGGKAELNVVIDFVKGLLDGEAVTVNNEVARSDQEVGNLNRALMNLCRHFDNFHCDIEQVMDAYVRQCAIELSCRQLARVGRFLMLEGPDSASNPDEIGARRARRIMSLMLTCGQYDGSGDFAYRVGLPAKSGVGGGILAIVPNIASIAVWAPGLDANGNSLLGTLALEHLTNRVNWSVFGSIGRS